MNFGLLFQFFGSSREGKREREEEKKPNNTKIPTQAFLFPEVTTTDYLHFLLKSRVTAGKISKYTDALMRGRSSQKQ